MVGFKKQSAWAAVASRLESSLSRSLSLSRPALLIWHRGGRGSRIPMALVLHAGNTNKNAFKTLIATDYSGVQVELTKNFEMGVSDKTSMFLKMNPIGQVPVLETPDVDANISHWLYPSLAISAISCLKRALGALNPHLAMDMFLVGHSVTLADIIMTCNLYLGFSLIMLKSFTSEFPRVEGFCDMYDPKGYSLWFCDYKYNEENTVSFMTLNKVSGFLQRMDLAHKYAFGKMLVIGSDPPFKVKVDISDEAQKERVNAMIEEQEPFEVYISDNTHHIHLEFYQVYQLLFVWKLSLRLSCIYRIEAIMATSDQKITGG
ncbi:hypothetical protein OPV22_012701 [Ensete ventricosum]|uniref:GST N-terminal domain-containing protein n=1 Tax=Ensete ventricosum TaxID=4639 RepID=A0AAV8QXQ0_ENSVE|nr:hypothetical protein OPV22_012701 [Ensete ventricosum]